jgi:hypothetical protein
MSDQAWRTLSDHLDQVLGLPEPQRAQWLSDLRGREPALAAQLAELLEAREQKGYSEFLSGPSPLPASAANIASLIGRRGATMADTRDMSLSNSCMPPG